MMQPIQLLLWLLWSASTAALLYAILLPGQEVEDRRRMRSMASR
jgi:hypothetical protein